ncbi:Macrophage mannose receptor 1 [Dirofilaria immitis]|nr:Macrophage mannose receptor 1 [Dirofilaria immitis]
MYMIFLFLLSALYLIDKTSGNENAEETKGNLERGKLSCHNGWVPFASIGSAKYTHCLKVLTVFRMTWQQAEESCRQVGKDGHLVSIQTLEQIGWLTEAIDTEMQSRGKTYSLFPKNFPWYDSGWWIGLGQLCPNTQINQMPPFRWTDGTLFDNDKITIGDVRLTLPKTSKWDNHYCIFYDYQKSVTGTVSNRMFNVSRCSDRRRFICQMPAFSQDLISDGGGIVAEEEVKLWKAKIMYLPKNDTVCYRLHVEQVLQCEHVKISRRMIPCGKDPLFCPLRTGEGTVCYRLQTEPYYWEQAAEECDAKYQSDLTSIHSKEEANFIYEMVQLQPSVSGETKYWIGLHRRNAKSQYEWSDGSSFDYLMERISNEDPDEENGNCVAMQFNTSTKSLQKQPIYNFFGIPTTQGPKNLPAYFWTHQRCDNRHLAICRKLGFDYHAVSELSAKEVRRLKKHKNWKCPNGYKLFRGMCYKVYGTKGNGATFNEAIQRCKNEKLI